MSEHTSEVCVAEINREAVTETTRPEAKFRRKAQFDGSGPESSPVQRRHWHKIYSSPEQERTLLLPVPSLTTSMTCISRSIHPFRLSESCRKLPISRRCLKHFRPTVCVRPAVFNISPYLEFCSALAHRNVLQTLTLPGYKDQLYSTNILNSFSASSPTASHLPITSLPFSSTAMFFQKLQSVIALALVSSVLSASVPGFFVSVLLLL